MVAAAKAGFKVVDIDVNITDVVSIREFLRASEAKAIYFLPTYNDVNYTNLLRKAIPEFFNCKLKFFLIIYHCNLFY
jgi:hypothetical protein